MKSLKEILSGLLFKEEPFPTHRLKGDESWYLPGSHGVFSKLSPDTKSVTMELWLDKHPDSILTDGSALFDDGKLGIFQPGEIKVLVEKWRTISPKTDAIVSLQADIGTGVVRGYRYRTNEAIPPNVKGHIIKPFFDAEIEPLTIGVEGKSLIFHTLLWSETIEHDIECFTRLMKLFFSGEDVRKILHLEYNPMKLEIVVSVKELTANDTAVTEKLANIQVHQ